MALVCAIGARRSVDSLYDVEGRELNVYDGVYRFDGSHVGHNEGE